jgi:hypothetical protein
MYNIAKVAKGEILVYFNQVFDALCKVGLLYRSTPDIADTPSSWLPTQSCQSRMAPNS